MGRGGVGEVGWGDVEGEWRTIGLCWMTFVLSLQKKTQPTAPEGRCVEYVGCMGREGHGVYGGRGMGCMGREGHALSVPYGLCG